MLRKSRLRQKNSLLIKKRVHWDKTKILQKFPSDKLNGTKNALFFLSRAPTNHTFTFNYLFSYELEHMVQLSRTVRGIFHFRFRLIFIKVYIFVQQKTWTLLALKRHNFFQNKNNTKTTHSFTPRPLIFKLIFKQL